MQVTSKISRLLIGSIAFLLVACAGSEATAPARTPSPSATISHVTLKAPEGIAVGTDGSVYVSDYEGEYVFRLQPDRSLVIVAGTGKSGEGGDGGLAIKATLSAPSGLAVDRSGNLFVADQQGRRIRRVDSQGTRLSQRRRTTRTLEPSMNCSAKAGSYGIEGAEVGISSQS